MVSPLQRTVRMPTDAYQTNYTSDVRYGGEEANRRVAPHAESFDDRRSPESERWIGTGQAKLNERV